jgi:hypothetical protein
MSKINFDAMSDQELRQYFLNNKQDPEVLSAYLARRSRSNKTVIAKVDDPDFEAKVLAYIQEQLRQYEASQFSD